MTLGYMCGKHDTGGMQFCTYEYIIYGACFLAIGGITLSVMS